jgi:hypothetical protein
LKNHFSSLLVDFVYLTDDHNTSSVFCFAKSTFPCRTATLLSQATFPLAGESPTGEGLKYAPTSVIYFFLCGGFFFFTEKPNLPFLLAPLCKGSCRRSIALI